jgi:phosphate transport system substrate-binding protein
MSSWVQKFNAILMKLICNKLLLEKSMFPLPKRICSATSIVGAVILAMSLPAFAQSQPIVTLDSPTGSISITGELIAFDEENFTIKGTLGLMTVPRNAVQCTGAGCPVVPIIPEVVATTRQVVLNSIDDETRISGELLAVEEGHYVIRNALGEFRVAAGNVSCEGPACPVIDTYKPEFTIFASSPRISTMLADLLVGYAEETGQTFESKANDETTRSVQIFSSDDSELVADISLVIRSPQDAVGALSDRSAEVLVYEQQQIDTLLASAAGLNDLLQSPLAFDGQVIVGHRDNPVRDLSLVEISRIWDRDITSWRSLGAGEAPITIHMAEEGGDTAGWLTGLSASSTSAVITHSTEAQVVEAVKANRNALGLVHRTVADQSNAKMLAVRKACGLTAEPTQFGIRTQHYPFTQPIYSYARGTGAHPFAQSFLEWTQTAAAATNITKWGYTAAKLQREKIQDMGVAVVHTAAVEPDFDGVEFASMMRELRSADRLSITFRFLTGSSVLDEESLLNIKDLAKRLRGNEFDGQEVLLVGFADNTGPAAPNTSLSARRAQAVQDVLAQEFDPTTLQRLNLTSMGFGEQMPVDCNDTDSGRASNRRVEVWARVQN